MTVVITGGLGHIGSYVAAKLAEQGDTVIIVDEHAARFDEVAPDYLRNVRERLVLEQGSVADFDTLQAIFQRNEGRVSSVVHLAGLGGVEAFTSEPRTSVYVNVAGTLNVLEAARLTQVKRVVYVSSGAVYGRRPGVLREADGYQVDDLYGASKVSGELLALQYGRTFGMECCCARVYFVYGPGRLPSAMYPLYKGLFSPLEGADAELPNIREDQQLDFTYIDDTAQGIIRICAQRELPSAAYNISSGQAVTIGEAARTVRNVAGMRAASPAMGSGVLQRGAPLDISLAAKELRYQPQYTDFRSGASAYANWIKRQSANL